VERGVWQDAKRGMLGHGWPVLPTLGAVPERGKLSAAKPGCRARFLFGYFLFCASKEKVTRRGAKPIVSAIEVQRLIVVCPRLLQSPIVTRLLACNPSGFKFGRRFLPRFFDTFEIAARWCCCAGFQERNIQGFQSRLSFASKCNDNCFWQ
jgi:hypothetical protein